MNFSDISNQSPTQVSAEISILPSQNQYTVKEEYRYQSETPTMYRISQPRQLEADDTFVIAKRFAQLGNLNMNHWSDEIGYYGGTGLNGTNKYETLSHAKSAILRSVGLCLDTYIEFNKDPTPKLDVSW